jgi:L-alanine-DL-glutamate epimerase-like enolase superfamily enzyme
MIITRIECFPLRIPFKPGKSDASAWGDKDLPTADSLLVKVTTDQGLEGWGEAFGFRAVSSVKLAVNELIAPFCIGKDATQIAPLMLDVQKKLHVFGRGGALAFAISAVDIALWDIAGKAANAPVCRLLGGGYASLVRYSEPSLVRAAVRRAIEAGFGTLKLQRNRALGNPCRPRGGRPRHRVDARRQLPLDLDGSSRQRGRPQGGQFEMAGRADLATRSPPWSQRQYADQLSRLQANAGSSWG